jgi:pimeloyl-ACP methyl ester carboxylesterase
LQTNVQLDRKAVVFIHGIGGAARLWARQLASFAAKGFAPLAVDLPGYGGRPSVDAMDFETLAQDVENAIAAHDLRRPLIVGHSLGGMIAQTMLRRRPDAYGAAVLAATSPAFGNPSGDFQKQFVAQRLAPLEAGKSMRDLADRLVDGLIGDAPDVEGRALAIDVMGSVPAATYRAAVRCLVDFDERPNLPNIRVPVLCLAGGKDRTAPASVMERMASKIPGARCRCLVDVGHLMNVEDPEGFDRAVIEFLQEVRS